MLYLTSRVLHSMLQYANINFFSAEFFNFFFLKRTSRSLLRQMLLGYFHKSYVIVIYLSIKQHHGCFSFHWFHDSNAPRFFLPSQFLHPDRNREHNSTTVYSVQLNHKEDSQHQSTSRNTILLNAAHHESILSLCHNCESFLVVVQFSLHFNIFNNNCRNSYKKCILQLRAIDNKIVDHKSDK